MSPGKYERRPAGDRTALEVEAGDPTATTIADPSDIEPRLRAEIESHGLPLNRLTVLSSQRDPFRLDTPAGHRDGAWLAQQIADLGIGDRTIHLRGLHYAILSLATTKPDGLPYVNDDRTWTWMSEKAAAAARWLGYVPFDRIVDQRNDAPVIYPRPEDWPRPYVSLGGVDVSIPDDVDDPTVGLSGVAAQQPYRIVLVGEKSSLGPVLGSVAGRYSCDLYLPTGEISSTQAHGMARASAHEDRPMIVFYFADCDPAGWSMPVSLSRKLQAFRTALFPDLAFQVHRVALTPDHVRRYGLPSTPLKDSEKRKDKWKSAMGVDQTEIDALAALQPDLLRQLADDAVAPYYDFSIHRRVLDAVQQWERDAQARIEDLLDVEQRERLREEARAKLATLRDEVRAIDEALRVDVSGMDLPEFETPESNLSEPDGLPLVDSRWSFPDQCRALIASKAYTEGMAS